MSAIPGKAPSVTRPPANLDEETAALERLAGHADRLARLAVEQPNPA
jgi:hypothetical protein